jgi:hypothetical protein
VRVLRRLRDDGAACVAHGLARLPARRKAQAGLCAERWRCALVSSAVCRSVISQIDASLTTKQRADVESVEKVMRSWCDTSKGKDKTMCYYMGVGDAEQVRCACRRRRRRRSCHGQRVESGWLMRP